MRPVLPTLVVLVTGCAAPPAPVVPAATARAIEVAPVRPEPEEPSAPPAPRPPSPEEMAEKMAAALDARSARPAGERRTSLAGLGLGGGVPPSDDPDVMVTFKVVSAQGKFVAGGITFALDMHDYSFGHCLTEQGVTERKGSVTATVAFDADGSAVEPVVKSSTFKDRSITECVRSAFKQIDPASHTTNGPDVQANQRATVQVDLERPQGF
jgi:hypothetical protein